jgi:hypothetical protein
MTRRALGAATITAAAVPAALRPAALDVARVEDRIRDPRAHGRIT